MLNPHERLRPHPTDVAAKVIDGEAIIMNLASGMYYSMAGSGAAVWERVAEGTSTENMTAALTRRYDVAAERARADVERLVGRLLEEGLVQVVDGTAEAVDAHTGEPDGDAGKRPYEPPALEKYTDMADLLALDPPMPDATAVAWTDEQ